MTYPRLLIATHFAAVLTAAVIVRFRTSAGAGLAEFTLLVLCCAAAPAAASVWWLRSRMRKVRDVDATFALQTGISELDTLAERLRSVRDQDRSQWHEARQLLEKLTPIRGYLENIDAEQPPGKSLIMLLGRLARGAATESAKVASLSETITQQAAQAGAMVREQWTHVSGAIETVEQLSAEIDRIMHGVAGARDAAAAAGAASERGGSLIDSLVSGMGEINSSVEVGERRVLALGERFQEIESIVETMSAISARTDLLALNAEIEAVRAGQEGSGFAAVAEEVRKLAERTASASREITDLVNSMQIETKETITAMKEERAQVHAEVQRVGAAGEVLRAITQSLSQLLEHVGEIAGASEKQLHGTRRIVACAQQISAGAESLGQTTQSAREQGEQLSAAVRDLELRLSPLYRCDVSTTSPGRLSRRETDHPADGGASVGAVDAPSRGAGRLQAALAGGAT